MSRYRGGVAATLAGVALHCATARASLKANEICNFSESNSWEHFSGSAIILVPTVVLADVRMFMFFVRGHGREQASEQVAGERHPTLKKSLVCLKFWDVTVSRPTPTPWSGPFRDHGLRPWSQSPSEHRKPINKGFSGSGAPIFGFGLADPAPKGWG